MKWDLARPEPALPSSYFWTWDHSTNWMLDDPGVLNFGCHNRYLKRAETFREDYRRLVDFADGLGVRGVVVWGFLRDAHGGIDAGKRIADYAASRNVRLMPGVGTTWYGGFYYEGDHPYNLETFLDAHPEARMIGEDGRPRPHGACPSHPAFQDWLRAGMEWLLEEFNIGGMNLENGDLLVCHDERCRARRESWPEGDPEPLRLQAMSYVPACEAAREELSDRLITWATYCGFLPGEDGGVRNAGASMGCTEPEICKRVPEGSVAQWTLSGMVHPTPLPLTVWLDDGAPEAAFDNPNWPRSLRPPNGRSVGFCHQASQWSWIFRYSLAISTIKEACLRAHRSGLEGVSIHGEVTPLHVPWALNYLAFSHFIHYPEDDLRRFGRATLGQVLGGEDEGERFAVLLARWDGDVLDEEDVREVEGREKELRGDVAAGRHLDRWRFWYWLRWMTDRRTEEHTASFF